jgi:hypothetical protein
VTSVTAPALYTWCNEWGRCCSFFPYKQDHLLLHRDGRGNASSSSGMTGSEVEPLEERIVATTTLNLSTLEELCRSEIESNCLGDPTNARFSFELLRHATLQDNQEAREAWQRCFGEVLRSWLRRHPRTEEACRFDSEEHYLAQTFECFWQTVADWQLIEFTELSTALRCLQASLTGVLLDTFRAHTRPRGIQSSELDNSGELRLEDDMNGRQLRERIHRLFPHVHERRVAFLLFHCNLSPSDILRYVPQEFRDVQEICHLRRHILERILLYSDLML